MDSLIGKKVSFIPHCLKDLDDGNRKWDADPINGVVECVNKKHGWFRVAYHAGRTVQYECFKFCDIGGAVMVHGNKKGR